MVTLTVHLLSGGGSGMMYGGDQGEFAYGRVSIHVFNWSGARLTAAAFPRYTIQDSRSPGPLLADSDDEGVGSEGAAGA